MRNQGKKKISMILAILIFCLSVFGTCSLSLPVYAVESNDQELVQTMDENDVQSSIIENISNEQIEEIENESKEKDVKEESFSEENPEAKEKEAAGMIEDSETTPSMESISLMASTPESGYAVWDSLYDRKVTNASGNVDAEWSLCMNTDRSTPGTSSAGTKGYDKIDFADESVYRANRSGSNPNFQRVKRILYYRMTHPNTNWSVLQNEYWYGETGRSYYNTSWGVSNLDAQKMAIRAAANDSSLDELIDERMVVTVYRYNGSKYQNTITARMETIDIAVKKVWNNEAGLSLPETIRVHLLEESGSLHIRNADLTLSDANGWCGTITNLPKYTGLNTGNPKTAVYSLKEDEVPGFTSEITGDSANGYIITNTSAASTPTLGNLTVSKSVTGNMGERQRAFEIHVVFNAANLDTKDMQGSIFYDYSGSRNEITPDQLLESGEDGLDVELLLKDGESVSFLDIPYGMHYQIIEKDYSSEGYDPPYYETEERTEKTEFNDVIESEDFQIEVINNRSALIDTGIDQGTFAAFFRAFLHSQK